MKYMLLLVDDGAMAQTHAEPVDTGAPVEWVDEMTRRGVSLGGARLRPPAEARTVRRQGSQTVVADGPFAEAREQVTGFDLIEATDLDEAIEVASKHPAAGHGPIEIRPLWGAGADLDPEALARL